jgi:hypothetical protein
MPNTRMGPNGCRARQIRLPMAGPGSRVREPARHGARMPVNLSPLGAQAEANPRSRSLSGSRRAINVALFKLIWAVDLFPGAHTSSLPATRSTSMFNHLRSLFRPRPAITDPYEQFVLAFIEERKRQGRQPTSYDHQARSFVFSDTKEESHKVFLENVFRMWGGSDARSRVEQLSRFVRSIGEAETAVDIDPSKLAAELMPGVRSRTLISHTLIQNWMGGYREGNAAEMAWTPLCGELAACVIRDLPDSMVPMTRSNLDFAKLSFDRAMACAMAQFRAKAPVPEFEPVPRAAGLFYCGNLEDYQSSLLLMAPGREFVFPPLDGDPVALVPARNQFFVSGSRNRPALSALLNLAETAGRQAHFCSSALWVWRDGCWLEYAFNAGTHEAIKQRQMAVAQLASDYDQQKGLLDHLHQTQNTDIYVAEFMVCRKNDDDGSEFSFTTLASGTNGTLLPVADRLIFVDQVVDPQTGMAAEKAREIVQVAWSDAMAVAGPLLEPVPHLYPPRYRAVGFPDADTRSRLRTKAVN